MQWRKGVECSDSACVFFEPRVKVTGAREDSSEMSNNVSAYESLEVRIDFHKVLQSEKRMYGYDI